MRNFKKVMALAISTAAIASSVSAFAATEYSVTGLNGTYDADANALTLTVDGASGDKTVLVLGNGVVDTAATGEDILYINQYTASETAFAAMGLKGTEALAVGTYAVKIGYTDANGDFAIANGSIVVEEKEEGQKITLVYGDVTADGAADTSDSVAILTKLAGGPTTAGDSEYEIGSTVGSLVYGDVTADGAADTSDSVAILTKLAGGPTTAGDSEIEIGSNVEVIIK